MGRLEPEPQGQCSILDDISNNAFQKLVASGLFDWCVTEDGKVKVTRGNEHRVGRTLCQAFGNWLQPYK